MNAPDLRFIQPRRPGRGVTVASLSLHATYQAPSGRLCRLVRRFGEPEPGSMSDSFSFQYTDCPDTEYHREREGFRLTAANVPMLREVLR